MKVVLIGSGNVATHLGAALKAAGHEIVQVWSRTAAHAVILAEKLSAEPAGGDTGSLSDAGEIYILAVSDDAIPAMAARFPYNGRLLVHTSGTADLNVLEEASSVTGVFYPLQTFSKQKAVNFKDIPLAVEGNSTAVSDLLLSLASGISDHAVLMDSEKRRALHLAAVFACNFSNHLYAVAEQILKDYGLKFDLIRPLITETAEKIQSFSPAEVQTGPAVRNDRATIDKHLKLLAGNPDLCILYEKLSQNILDFHKKP